MKLVCFFILGCFSLKKKSRAERFRVIALKSDGLHLNPPFVLALSVVCGHSMSLCSEPLHILEGWGMNKMK